MKKIITTSLLLLAGILSLGAQSIVTTDQSVNQSVKEDLPNWRISASAGGFYQIGRIPDGLSPEALEHAKSLKWGVTYDVDATRYFRGTLGLGVKYNSVYTSHEQSLPYSGEFSPSYLSDDINVWFLGPMISMRGFTKGWSNFIVNVGLGYMGYRDKATLSGRTIGVMGEAGYELALSKTVKLEALFSFYGGRLSSVTQTWDGFERRIQLGKDEEVSLGHLDLKIGLSFNF